MTVSEERCSDSLLLSLAPSHVDASIEQNIECMENIKIMADLCLVLRQWETPGRLGNWFGECCSGYVEAEAEV